MRGIRLCLFLQISDQRRIERALHQQTPTADQEKLVACPCDCHVEPSIDGCSVVGLDDGREQRELVGAAHGGAVDDDVFLAALIAFDGVDEHLPCCDDTCLSKGCAQRGDLTAEGNDDADLSGDVEGEVVGVMKMDELHDKSGDGLCFGYVGLGLTLGERGGGYVEEGDPAGGNDGFVARI